MKALVQFLKVTLKGGILVVLPIWLTVLLIIEVVKGALIVLRPIARLLPQSRSHVDLWALALLLLLCFAAGLLTRTSPARRLGNWLERNFLSHLPAYTSIRSLIWQMAGQGDKQSFQPALVEIGAALVPAFIVEKHEDGQFTVFVSSSPAPMAGSIYILPPERVHPLDVPLHKEMICVAKWGAGLAELRAAMSPK